MTAVTVLARGALTGTVAIPGDKSISHRALLLGALARGRSYVGNLSPAADVGSTAACLLACGAALRDFGDGRVVLDGTGSARGLRSPAAPLDCGNSGTTMRLLAGVLAGAPVEAVLDGDASLRRRPMERVAEPLRRMGAAVATSAGTAPLRIAGRAPLTAIDYVPPVASAQLKSAVLLAGLGADGLTRVREALPTRDHTERMLRMCGLACETAVAGAVSEVTLRPGPLAPFGLRVPGDLSSAAFLLALAAALPGSLLRCPGVTLNAGRTGVLDALAAMGALVEIEPADPAGGVEPVGTVTVRTPAGAHGLRATRIDGALVPRCIDELPVLAVLATQAEGVTEIRDAAELRVKESDRVGLVAAGLRALGADVEEHPDGLSVAGPTRLRGTGLDAAGDHRLAMAWGVAGSLASGETMIEGAEAVAVSYPGFFEELERVASSRHGSATDR